MSPATGRLATLSGPIALLVCFAAGGVLFATAGRPLTLPEALAGTVIVGIVLVVAVVGTVILRTGRADAIGWLFQVIAVVGGAEVVFQGLSRHGAPGSRLALVGYWYANWNWVPVVLLMTTFVLLLFPDGRLPDGRRRWRVVAWCAGAGIAALTLDAAFSPGMLDESPGVANPFPVSALAWLGHVSIVLLPVALIGTVAALVTRRRRANDVAAQQLRWLFFSGALLVACLVVGTVVSVASAGRYELVANLVILLAVASVPAAVSVSILRYRLYDIDRLVSRTVSYAAVTAVLAAVYAAGVIGVQALVPAARSSNVVVAVSTLAVAGLFRPVRTRVQAGVDRRFNRGRYDAERTLGAFASRLRDEVRLESLAEELVTVVGATMAPRAVSLWLRPPPGRPGARPASP